MNRPEWGAMFFDEAVNSGAKMFWGARGTIRYRPGGCWNNYTSSRELEIYHDRQSFTAEETAGKQDFVDWINDKLIPCIEGCVRAYDTKHVELMSDDGRFRAVVEDRDSGGYLYVGAWA